MKNCKGFRSGHGLFGVLSWHLPRRREENHEKPARIVYRVVWQEYTDTLKEYFASIFRVKSKLRLIQKTDIRGWKFW
jgi:hypothetical protein